MAIPVIYKGDDTDFRGSTGFTLKVVTSSNLNLSGCTVEVEVLGFKRSFPASATGELVCPFAFTAAETQRMPLGIHAATVRVYDSKGRVRTINNSIRVKVTNSVHEAYGKDDPQEVTLAVSTVDLEAYAKKADVTAAITAALKDAGASVKLHALTPEVTDATVTLKPVDGTANYVAEPLTGMKPADGGEFSLCVLDLGPLGFDMIFAGMYYGCDVKFDFVERVQLNGVRYVATEYGYATVFNITVMDDLDGTLAALRPLDEIEGAVNAFPFGVGEKLIRIPVGTVLDIIRLGPDVTANTEQEIVLSVDGEEFSIMQDPSGMNPLETGGFVNLHPELEGFEILDFFGDYVQGTIYFDVSGGKAYNLQVAIPASTDSAKARKFTLAVETDVETETTVEWEDGEVVEAVPGASKLVPGLTVWDVAEVAPGKFKVERASTPAQSAPLTLTAPGGRVAELTVGDDLVLEVKEI